MNDCRGELLLRVRRGLASEQERMALDGHLSVCENCRLTLEVMGDFDASGTTEPRDSERVARLAAAAVGAGRSAFPRSLRAPRRVWSLGAAAAVFMGAALAGAAGWLVVRSANPEGALPESAPPEGAQPAPAAPKVAVSESTQPRRAPAATAQPEVEPVVEKPAAVAPAAPVGSAAPSPSELYRVANDARRAGRTDEAIRHYQLLLRRFPSSAEAQAGRVSLGGLLLRGGAAGTALTQFDTYLRGGGGQLAAEALYGRGRALEALGRRADEVQNWERMLKQYPGSAYATHARSRLDQLR